MNTNEVLTRIEQRMTELGVKPQTVSLTATGSPDTIRNWFRKMRKGDRFSMRQDTLEAVARALDMPIQWLTHGDEDAMPAHGMAEETVPFTPKPNEVQAVKSLYASTARHAQTARRAQIDLPGLGIAAGDIIVTDLGREASFGDLVLVTVEDETTAATTLIRRYFAPHLLAMSISDKEKPLRDDDPAVTIRYPVIGLIRGL